MMPEHVKQMRRAQRKYQRALARVEHLRDERDECIRLGIEEGMTHAQIYRALEKMNGPTRARIGQIALGPQRNGHEFSGSSGHLKTPSGPITS